MPEIAQNVPDMKLRIDADLRRKVEDAAKRNNRTLNGEIASRLQWSFDQENHASGLQNASGSADELEAVRVQLRAETTDRRRLASQVAALETTVGQVLEAMRKVGFDVTEEE